MAKPITDTTKDTMGDPARGDQERRQALERIQAAITEGLESGAPQPFDAESFKARMRASR